MNLLRKIHPPQEVLEAGVGAERVDLGEAQPCEIRIADMNTVCTSSRRPRAGLRRKLGADEESTRCVGVRLGGGVAYDQGAATEHAV